MSRIKKYHLLLWALVALLSSVMLVACSPKKVAKQAADEAVQAEQKTQPGGETLAKLRERGALKVGLSAFNPWAMQDVRGEWIGFEVDVAQKLAEDLGLQLELVPTAWAGIIPALLTGKFDIIIGGMSVTEERAQQVTFSEPYEYSKTVLLLRRDVPVNSAEEMNNPDYRFVGRAGSSPLALTRELFPDAQIKAFDDDGLSIQDLLNGQANAFLTTNIEAAEFVEKYPDSVFVPKWGQGLRKEDIAFALRKNVEKAWLDYLNQWIKESWANGFLAKKNRYWFDTRDWTKDYQLPE